MKKNRADVKLKRGLRWLSKTRSRVENLTYPTQSYGSDDERRVRADELLRKTSILHRAHCGSLPVSRLGGFHQVAW